MWKDHIDEYRESAPEQLKSVKQNAFIFWGWLETEKEFVVSAIQGIVFSLIACFIIMILATHNFVTAFLSLIAVGIVILSIITIIVLKGWEFGVSESICTVIIIGLSVDYCVHLAADYSESAHFHRKQKMKQSYRNMGESIVSGTITTLGSGAFLFGGKMVTFQKFAVIITSTIGVSFIASMLVFGAMMHTCGPMRGCGDLCYHCKDKQEEGDSEFEFD
jgi:predicted RND superfamily exporter protein